MSERAREIAPCHRALPLDAALPAAPITAFVHFRPAPAEVRRPALVLIEPLIRLEHQWRRRYDRSAPVGKRRALLQRRPRVCRGSGGLGLSIAKRAVEANGGTLTLEALEAPGSTFRIVLPGAPIIDGVYGG